MSERTAYPPGVPCWVEAVQPDPAAAAAFYASTFGWRFDGVPSAGIGGELVARHRDRQVAAVTSASAMAPARAGPEASWLTYVRVASVDKAAATATSLGGTVLLPPHDVPPAGRKAVLADPLGAAFGLWEPSSREGAELVNEAFCWDLSLNRTSDVSRAETFYGSLFGWRPELFGQPGAQLTLCRLDGYVGGLPGQYVPRDVVAVISRMREESGDGGAPHWTVDFFVDDVDSVAERADEAGASIVAPPHDLPGFRMALIVDPQGARFSISAPTPTAGR